MGADAGLSAISLTDHDTIGGLSEAAGECATRGVEFISGVELSCTHPAPGVVHLLGYGFDPANGELVRELERLRLIRQHRVERIVRRLAEMGLPITLEMVREICGPGSIGRPHIARALIRLHVVGSMKEAFDRYLAPGAPAYVEKDQMSPATAIALLHRAGGVAVLAHAVQLRTTSFDALAAEVRRLVEAGLDGLEIIHSEHGEGLMDALHRLADEHRLLKTGGSDFHGRRGSSVKLGNSGRKRVPREWFESLKARIHERREAS
jgi:predicted metal-dependent phosphoesterase TrpH